MRLVQKAWPHYHFGSSAEFSRDLDEGCNLPESPPPSWRLPTSPRPLDTHALIVEIPTPPPLLPTKVLGLGSSVIETKERYLTIKL